VIGIGGAGEEGPVVKEAPVGEAAVLADFKGTGADAAEGLLKDFFTARRA
jgi:hypothetical protein